MLNDMIENAGGCWSDRIGRNIRFADDKHEVAIQAADLLAWLIRRKSEGSLPSIYTGLLDKLVIWGVNRYHDIDREALLRISASFAEMPLASKIGKTDWMAQVPIWESGQAKAINDAIVATGLYPSR